mgnify:CR=1 FL=1
MNKKPLVSVLINNYNYANFIVEAVDSVRNQTYQNFEIIIVDDGSTDKSVDVINNIESASVIKVLKKNGGQGSAFNEGFKVSKGEIIAFLDSDDWWKPNKLEEVVRWHNFLSGDYALIQHNVDVWDNGETYPFKHAMYSGDCFGQTMKTSELGFFVGTSGLVFKREILKAILPVPDGFRISADAYLTRTSYTKGFVYSIPESLGYYRKHSNAVLGNESYSHSKFHRKVLFPSLNKFNKANGLPYRYKVGPKAQTIKGGVLKKVVRFIDLRNINRLSSIKRKFDPKTKVLVYGAGTITSKTLPMIEDYVSNIVDMDDSKKGQRFCGKDICSLGDIETTKFDYLLVTPRYREKEIIDMLIHEYGVEPEKLVVI